MEPLTIAILGCGSRGRTYVRIAASMPALDQKFRGPDALPAGLDGHAGHRLAFLAEESRLAGGIPCPATVVATR